jgi:putative mRNA 3-end processing factor
MTTVRYQVSSDYKNQIFLHNRDKKIYLDPRHLTSEDIVFISHAHVDHLVSKSSLKRLNLEKKIMCSEETIEMAKFST